MSTALALERDWNSESETFFTRSQQAVPGSLVERQRQYLVQDSHVSQLPAWLPPTVEQIHEFLGLLPNWDSYGASPIDPDNATTLLEVLLSAVPEACPAPQLVPTTAGNLQAEWHEGGFDIELLCEHPTQIQLYVADHASGQEAECTLSTNLTPLQDALRRLSMAAHD